MAELVVAVQLPSVSARSLPVRLPSGKMVSLIVSVVMVELATTAAAASAASPVLLMSVKFASSEVPRKSRGSAAVVKLAVGSVSLDSAVSVVVFDLAVLSSAATSNGISDVSITGGASLADGDKVVLLLEAEETARVVSVSASTVTVSTVGKGGSSSVVLFGRLDSAAESAAGATVSAS